MARQGWRVPDGKDAWPKLRRACEKELSPSNQDYSGSPANRSTLLGVARAHVVAAMLTSPAQRKVSNCASGVDRQPHSTLSPSQSSLSCPPTSPSASSPSRRPLPVPSCLPPTRNQPSSRASSPATVTSPVATVPLQPLPRRVSTPYSRPAFLLPSPPLSPLLPSPFKSSFLLCVFLTLVILLQISPL